MKQRYWTVAVNNQSAGVFIDGLTQFDPPTVGSSRASFAIANDGSSFASTPTVNNVYFELQADGTDVPEQVSALMTGVGLGALLAFRRARGRQN